MDYCQTKEGARVIYLDGYMGLLSDLTVVWNETETLFVPTFEYRYSFDDISWSDRFATVAEMITDITDSGIIYTNVYIAVHVNIEYPIDTQAIVEAFKITDIILTDGVDETLVEDYSISYDRVAQTSINTRFTKNLFNPYRNSECIIDLHKKISMSVSNIFGLKVTYFKVNPKVESMSAVFKQYKLRNVTDIKELKVLPPNNNIPLNRTVYHDVSWGLGFEETMALDIVKEEFHNVFGDDQQPESKDYLYFHLTKRMYTVNTAYDHKTTMYAGTFYKAILLKYEDEAMIDKSLADTPEFEDVTDAVPDVWHDYEDDLAKKHVEEMNTLIAIHDQENNEGVRDDAVQADIDTFVDPDGYTQIFNYMYDLVGVDNAESAISYAATEFGNELTVFAWFRVTDTTVDNNIFEVKYIDPLDPINIQKITLSYSGGTGYYTMTIDDGVSVNTITTTGTQCVDNKLYGLSLRYSPTFASLTIVDEDKNYVQENYLDVNIVSISEFSIMNIFGGFGHITAVRPVNRSIPRNDIFLHLFDADADYREDVLFLDKGVPQIEQKESPEAFTPIL